MKRLKYLPLLLLWLAAGHMANAQTVVEGTNLNVETYGNHPNTLDGDRGNAIGIDHWLGGYNSLAVGNNDTILNNANSSIALGSLNRVGGLMSMAIGSNVKIGNSYSIGIGHDLNLTGSSGCMAIGNGFIGAGNNPNVFLENSYGNTLVIGFKSIRPTLTVGPSPNDYPNGDTLTKTGKVAIGDVPVPDIAAKLHIRSDYGEDAGLFLEPKDLENSSAFILMRDEDHGIEVDEEGVMTITSQDGAQLRPLLIKGKVGINVPDESHLVSSFSLCVNGNILTDKVTIKNYSQWHDYVFDSGYPLMPLSDLKTYISLNRHLPDIPSESEVVDQGVEIGDMQGLLLKKIEELTLYTIQLQEQIESMKKELDELKCKQKM